MQDVPRAIRAKQIREELGDTGAPFAARVMAKAAELGISLSAKFDQSVVSKIEGAIRAIAVEEAAVYVALDPKGRGWDWFVVGAKKASAPRGKVTIAVSTTQPSAAELKRQREAEGRKTG